MSGAYTLQRGETLSLTIEALTGNPSEVSGVTSKMKPVPIGRQTLMPGDEVPTVATLTVVYLPPTTGFLGGWELRLNSVQTALLPAGLYLIDASFTVAGITVIDGPLLLEVKNSAAGS